jgi:hypothetical protein
VGQRTRLQLEQPTRQPRRTILRVDAVRGRHVREEVPALTLGQPLEQGLEVAQHAGDKEPAASRDGLALLLGEVEDALVLREDVERRAVHVQLTGRVERDAPRVARAPEHPDAVGGEHERAADGQLRPASRAEPHTEPRQVGPAHDLVPDHVGHLAECRLRGGVERGLVSVGAGEQFGRRARLLGAGPVDDGVVDDEDVGRCRPEALGDGGDGPAREVVRGLGEPDVVPVDELEGAVARLADPEPRVEVDHLDPVVRGRELVEDLRPVVGRGVVHGDDLEVGEGLAEDRGHALADVRLLAVHHEDEADPGRARGAQAGHVSDRVGTGARGPLTAGDIERDVTGR